MKNHNETNKNLDRRSFLRSVSWLPIAFFVRKLAPEDKTQVVRVMEVKEVHIYH